MFLLQVNELPQPCTDLPKEVTPKDGNVEMKIAWRYEGLGQVESSFGSNTSFGHHFDLSKHMDKETVQKSSITYCFLNEDEYGHKDKVKGNYVFVYTVLTLHGDKSKLMMMMTYLISQLTISILTRMSHI